MTFIAPNPIGIETKVTANDDKSNVYSLTASSIIPQNLITLTLSLAIKLVIMLLLNITVHFLERSLQHLMNLHK